MRINVGSKNQVKIEAVKETIQNYNFLRNFEVNGVEVLSNVSDQPKSLEETIEGAKNRAKNAFQNCNFSFGIEGGLFKVPSSKSGYMEICACVIFDGINFHIGMSSVFEYPKKMMELILKNNLDASQAMFQSGLTQNKNIGSDIGAIGVLTKGRLNRKELTKQAVVNALIHLENPELY
jgi:inosine/xanthosine triphosphatase